MLHDRLNATRQEYLTRGFSTEHVNLVNITPDFEDSIDASCAVSGDFVISSDTSRMLYHVQPQYDGIGVLGHISPLMTFSGNATRSTRCMDIAFGNDKLLAAFTDDSGLNWVAVSTAHGENLRTICYNPTLITSVSYCWDKIVFCTPVEHQVKAVDTNGEGEVTVIAGSGFVGKARGSALSASLHQPIALCS